MTDLQSLFDAVGDEENNAEPRNDAGAQVALDILTVEQQARDNVNEQQTSRGKPTPKESTDDAKTSTDSSGKKRKKKSTAASSKSASRTDDDRVTPPVRGVYARTPGNQPIEGTMFRAVFPDAAKLGMHLATLRSLMPVCELVFHTTTERSDDAHHKGLSIVGIDNANTVYVTVSVPTASFLLYENQPQSPSCSIMVHPQTFFNHRTNFKTTHTLTLSRMLSNDGDSGAPLGVHLFPAFAYNRRARASDLFVPVIDETVDQFPPLDSATMHQYLVLMRAADLRRIVTEFGSIYEEARFSMSEGRFEITGVSMSVSETEVQTHGIHYDAQTSPDPIRKPIAADSIGSFKPPVNDLGVISDAERAAYESIDSERHNGVELCRLERLPFAPDDVGRADLDTIRMSTQFLKEAMAMSSNSDYVEMRFGRMTADLSAISPIRLTFRVLNDDKSRALITTHAYVAPLLDQRF